MICWMQPFHEISGAETKGSMGSLRNVHPKAATLAAPTTITAATAIETAASILSTATEFSTSALACPFIEDAATSETASSVEVTTIAAVPPTENAVKKLPTGTTKRHAPLIDRRARYNVSVIRSMRFSSSIT